MRRAAHAACWAALLVAAGPRLLAGEPAAGPEGPSAPSYPPTSGLPALRGALRALPNGRIELFYDWSDPAQLSDWQALAGDTPQLVDGELRLGSEQSHTLRHVAAFLGSVELAGTWRVRDELASHAHCGVALCAGPAHGYWLYLRDWHQEIYREDAQAAFLAARELRCRDGAEHAFHFARAGNLLRTWVNGVPHMRASDPAYHQGAVLLRAWRMRAGLRSIWLLGRLDTRWLARNPAVAAQVERLRLYAAGADALRPLWDAGQHADALAKAKALAAQAPFDASPQAVQWLVEDAQAVAALSQAIAEGIGKLKPGEPIRIAGAEAVFRGFQGGLLRAERDGTDASARIASLHCDEVLALAARARALDPARDHLALALLRLHGERPDVAAATAELGSAQQAGLDVARHRGLVIPRPPTAERLAATARTLAERPTFTGKPLVLEAEDAMVRTGALEVARDPDASGRRFVWEPRAEGADQYGRPTSRLVFHLLANDPHSVYLWARVRCPSSEANSFLFALVPGEVESGSLKAWHFAPQPGWQWAPYSAASAVDRGSARPTPLQLQPGVNSIIVAVRERAAALDKLHLSEAPDPPAEP